MNRVYFTAFGIALGMMMVIATGAVQNQDAGGFQMDEQAAAMVQALKTAHENPTAPSAFHEKLEHFIGEWDVTTRMWMMGPGSPPTETRGTATVEWMLGKRFAIERFDSEINMGGMTMDFESLSIVGYDNYANQYVGSLHNSMSTEVIRYKGGVSLNGKSFDYYGEMHEPMLNVAGRMIRIVTKIVDENHHTVSVYDLHAGPEYKVLEFAYARK